MSDNRDDIEITDSKGSSRFIVRFIRPNVKCDNKSRKIKGITGGEVSDKIRKVIEKWYSPRIILYSIEGNIIASNSKQNALKEYWKICDIKDCGKEFEVKILNN